jgi:glycosyltransferase involved in cell wall biosynthesis
LLRCRDRISAFVCPTAFTAEKLIDSGVARDKVFHVPTFVGHRVPAQGQGEFILFLGRFSQEKGIDVLLEAYAALPQPRPELVLAGARPGETERLAGLIGRCGGSVRVINFASKSEVEALLEKALYIVVPSLWYENSPNVVLEAFSCGRPVVASDIGSLGESVQDSITGRLFPPGDAGALTRIVAELRERPEELLRLGRGGYEYVRAVHSPEEHLRRLLAVFDFARATKP